MSYTEISADEMRNFFESRGYEKTRRPRDKEDSYVRRSTDSMLMIRVFSSMVDDRQRGKGEDAIRCNLMDVEADIPIWSMTKTLRLSTWQSNLLPKLEPFEEILRLNKRCPVCGNCMVPKESTWNPGTVFWGCLSFHRSQNCLSRDGMDKGLQARLMVNRQAKKRR